MDVYKILNEPNKVKIIPLNFAILLTSSLESSVKFEMSELRVAFFEFLVLELLFKDIVLTNKFTI